MNENEIGKVLTDEIMMRSQRISTQAFKLSDMMQQRIYQVEHKTNLIILFSIIGFAILAFFASFYNIRTIAGQIIREEELILLAIEDITERRQMEKKLYNSEKKYRELTENMRELIYVADPTTFAATYVNQADGKETLSV